MTRMYERAMTAIAAVASESITADTLGSESSVVDRTSSGNADGAHAFDVFALVGSDQSGLGGNCTLELHHAPYDPDNTVYATEDDSNYGDYSLTAEVPASDGSTTAFGVYVGRHFPISTKEKFKFKAVDYGVTCEMVVVPLYYSDT